MIQRKQTLWLLFASVSSFLSIKFPFYSGNVLNITSQQKQFTLLTANEPSLLILIFTVAIALASLALIFLYKNRPKQLLLTIITIILSLGNLALYYVETNKFVDGTFSLSAIISAVIPLFLSLAAMGIYKDEKLIKSVDRLR